MGPEHPLQEVPRTEEVLITVRYCTSSKMPIEICFQCFGDPLEGAPVVLLVCGLNMQLYAWDESFCEGLVRAGFYVIRYDNRDIGRSTKVENCGKVVGPGLLLPGKWASILGEKLPYTMEDMAKDGLALLDALKVPFAHVFGISMGGVIAQCMALLAPARVLSLVSVMSTTNAPDLPDAAMWVKLLMLRKPPPKCTLGELLEFRVGVLCRMLHHALPVDREYLKRRYRLSLQRSSYSPGLLRQAAALRRCEGRDEALRELKIPALVIHGARDVVVPPIHGYRTAAVLPHARMLIFKSMGHYFHPAFFGTIILTFAGMASTTAGGGKPLMGGFSPSFADEIALGGSFWTDDDDARTDFKGEEEGREPPPRPRMSSMGSFIKPFVVSPRTPTDAAARASLLLKESRGIGSPAIPEAVLIDFHDEDGEREGGNSKLHTTLPSTDAKMGDSASLEPSQSPEIAPFEPGLHSTWNRAGVRHPATTNAGEQTGLPLPLAHLYPTQTAFFPLRSANLEEIESTLLSPALMKVAELMEKDTPAI
ncbi:unnamed protein product [Phytomonas sp. Hart1]|nr:unnamed protein product [Phytomonas sp. Hart1]|eukprot:CCW70810.1 unnamed protein product [Phytomonas sp. isolate Hart1]